MIRPDKSHAFPGLHRIAGALLLLSAPLIGMAGNEQVQGKELSCAEPLSGTFITTFSNPDGSIASRGVITLFRDGNFLVGDSNQGGVAGIFNAFTTSQGAWRCTGKRGMSGVAINFTLPGVATDTGGIARVDYKAQYSSRNEISGSVELRFFGLAEDPANADAPPLATSNFTGRRISAK